MDTPTKMRRNEQTNVPPSEQGDDHPVQYRTLSLSASRPRRQSTAQAHAYGNFQSCGSMESPCGMRPRPFPYQRNNQEASMELRHLRYFIAVAEELNFGRAAQRLHVSQPALSRQIKDLESELGFSLLERLPRGASLTAAGNAFLDEARRIIADLVSAQLRAEKIARGTAGTLKIGVATGLAWHGRIAECFKQFRVAYPDARVELIHSLSIEQINALSAGDLDVGLGAGLLPLGEDLLANQFAHEGLRLAVPIGHPLTTLPNPTLAALREYPFIWFPREINPAFYDAMMSACQRGGLNPRIVQEASDRDTMMGLVQCQVGLCWQNESALWHLPPGVQLLQIEAMNVSLPFNIMWKKDNTSALLHGFVEIFRAADPPKRMIAAAIDADRPMRENRLVGVDLLRDFRTT
ncbi:MAG: LysR substrate-binding domain-containing protein [Pseudomonadota bacterium]|nr:LysR substrate-binding domain-containing protein [Pseudomonadota bacterium]